MADTAGIQIRNSKFKIANPKSESALSSFRIWDFEFRIFVSVLGQPRVVAHDEVAVDLLHEVEGHADDDQQARPAVELGHPVVDVHRRGDDGRIRSGNGWLR